MAINYDRRRLIQQAEFIARRDLSRESSTQQYVSDTFLEIPRVAGHFSHALYTMLTKMGEPSLEFLLSGVSPLHLWRRRQQHSLSPITMSRDKLDRNVTITGHTEALQSLSAQGSVMLVSTHQSHLDSVVLAYALWRLGLPPFLFGADAHLFERSLLRHALRNLGAYSINRRSGSIAHGLALRSFVMSSMMAGHDQMLFPAGQRSRSGAIETRLHHGLLACALATGIELYRRQKNCPIYIVPVHVHYDIVLEAETLITDHLRVRGHQQEVITDDEFSRPQRLSQFLQHLMALENHIHIHISQPLSVEGQPIEFSSQGRPLFEMNTVATLANDSQFQPLLFSRQRTDQAEHARQLVRHLGQQVVSGFHQSFTPRNTHWLAYTVLQCLWGSTAQWEQKLHEFQKNTLTPTLSIQDVWTTLRASLYELRLSYRNTVEQTIVSSDVDTILDQALMQFTLFHTIAPIIRRADMLVIQNVSLLYYYAQRLVSIEMHPIRIGNTKTHV